MLQSSKNALLKALSPTEAELVEENIRKLIKRGAFQFKVSRVEILSADVDEDRGFSSARLSVYLELEDVVSKKVDVVGYSKRNNAVHDVHSDVTGLTVAIRDGIRRATNTPRVD